MKEVVLFQPSMIAQTDNVVNQVRGHLVISLKFLQQLILRKGLFRTAAPFVCQLISQHSAATIISANLFLVFMMTHICANARYKEMLKFIKEITDLKKKSFPDFKKSFPNKLNPSKKLLFLRAKGFEKSTFLKNQLPQTYFK